MKLGWILGYLPREWKGRRIMRGGNFFWFISRCPFAMWSEAAENRADLGIDYDTQLWFSSTSEIFSTGYQILWLSPYKKYWGNMLWSAKQYWQIFTDKRERKPSVFHEVFSRVWSEYLKFCWAKLSILPLFLFFWSPQPTVMNTGKYPTLLSVLWRRKTWNNEE